MILYHGSYVVVKEPLVHVGRRTLDFGPGFYVTKLKEQALGLLRFVKPTHQMCISSQNVIEHYFKFTNAFNLG